MFRRIFFHKENNSEQKFFIWRTELITLSRFNVANSFIDDKSEYYTDREYVMMNVYGEQHDKQKVTKDRGVIMMSILFEHKGKTFRIINL